MLSLLSSLEEGDDEDDDDPLLRNLSVMIRSFLFSRISLEKEKVLLFHYSAFLMRNEELGCLLSTPRISILLVLKRCLKFGKALVQVTVEASQKQEDKFLEESILMKKFWKRNGASMPFKSCKTFMVCLDILLVETSLLKAFVLINKNGDAYRIGFTFCSCAFERSQVPPRTGLQEEERLIPPGIILDFSSGFLKYGEYFWKRDKAFMPLKLCKPFKVCFVMLLPSHSRVVSLRLASDGFNDLQNFWNNLLVHSCSFNVCLKFLETFIFECWLFKVDSNFHILLVTKDDTSRMERDSESFQEALLHVHMISGQVSGMHALKSSTRHDKLSSGDGKDLASFKGSVRDKEPKDNKESVTKDHGYRFVEPTVHALWEDVADLDMSLLSLGGSGRSSFIDRSILCAKEMSFCLLQVIIPFTDCPTGYNAKLLSCQEKAVCFCYFSAEFKEIRHPFLFNVIKHGNSIFHADLFLTDLYLFKVQGKGYSWFTFSTAFIESVRETSLHHVGRKSHTLDVIMHADNKGATVPQALWTTINNVVYYPTDKTKIADIQGATVPMHAKKDKVTDFPFVGGVRSASHAPQVPTGAQLVPMLWQPLLSYTEQEGTNHVSRIWLIYFPSRLTRLTMKWEGTFVPYFLQDMAGQCTHVTHSPRPCSLVDGLIFERKGRKNAIACKPRLLTSLVNVKDHLRHFGRVLNLLLNLTFKEIHPLDGRDSVHLCTVGLL